jgi:HSP20 family protein
MRLLKGAKKAPFSLFFSIGIGFELLVVKKQTMNRTTIYSPLEMMEKIFDNTNPVIQSRNYFVDEKDSEYVLEIPVSGFSKNDISVDVEGNFLVITGEDNESYWTDDFTRKFKLPNEADADSIKAKIEDGVLKVAIGKKKESMPKKIKIA